MMYVVGDKPLLLHMQLYIKAQWLRISLIKLISHFKVSILTLRNEYEFQRVIENGPYYMNRKLVMGKKWYLNFDFRKEILMKLPIWMRFP